MAENYELEILLKVKSQVNELIKTKEALRGVANETRSVSSASKDVNTNFGGSITGMQKGLRDLLSPITMLRRTIWQVGLAWSLTGGMAVASIKDIEAKTKNLQEVSIRTGRSVEDLSKEYYGFNIATKEASVASTSLLQIQQGMSNMWTRMTSNVANFVGALELAARENEAFERKMRDFQQKQGLFGAGPTLEQVRKMKDESRREVATQNAKDKAAALRNTDEFRKLEIQKNEIVNKATLSGFEYRRKTIEDEAELYRKAAFNPIEVEELRLSRYKEFDKERERSLISMQNSIIKSQGNEREAFLNNLNYETLVFSDAWSGDGTMMRIRKEFTDASIAEFDRARLGLMTNQQAMEGFTKQSVGAMKSSFTSLFSDVFTGQIKTAKEYFRAFVTDILNIWSRAMAEMAVAQIMGSKESGGWVSTLVHAALSVAGGYATAKTSGGGGTGGSTTAKTSGGGGTGANTASMLTSQGKSVGRYAAGGIAGRNGPELAIIGENEPEMVTPLSKMGVGGQQTKNVYYYIQAIDPRSFSEIVTSNPDAIVAVTERAIESNKKIRRTIKNLT